MNGFHLLGDPHLFTIDVCTTLGFIERSLLMSKKKQRIKSVKGFIKKSLNKRNAIVQSVVNRYRDLYETLYVEYRSKEPDNRLIRQLEKDVNDTFIHLLDVCTTSLVLSGKEWKQVLTRPHVNQECPGTLGLWCGDIPIDCVYRQYLDSNEKYRLGWSIEGCLMLFLVQERRNRKTKELAEELKHSIATDNRECIMGLLWSTKHLISPTNKDRG